MQDLKTVREEKRLTQVDLAQLSGLPQSHIASIETGEYLPQLRTRQRIERLIGSEINWLTTLAQDRGHIGYALNKLINAEEPGVTNRIKYAKQYLTELEKMLTMTDDEEILLPTGVKYGETETKSPDEVQDILYPTGVGPAQEDRTNLDLPPMMDD